MGHTLKFYETGDAGIQMMSVGEKNIPWAEKLNSYWSNPHQFEVEMSVPGYLPYSTISRPQKLKFTVFYHHYIYVVWRIFLQIYVKVY